MIPAGLSLAEYADVVINVRSEKEGVSPVIYPHWFHRIRYQCSVCHVQLGIQMKAGGNGITMERIINGEYCGACHNGEIAWSVENCDLCHSGKAGLETGIRGGHSTAGPGVY
jgi:c(7)-type cytochrome triheme protein